MTYKYNNTVYFWLYRDHISAIPFKVNLETRSITGLMQDYLKGECVTFACPKIVGEKVLLYLADNNSIHIYNMNTDETEYSEFLLNNEVYHEKRYFDIYEYIQNILK